MFTDDKIATAQIAQIFGSELLKVQSSAQTDSGSQPNIVRINPQQFLADSPHYQHAKKAEEIRLIQMLQQEAENAHPLPPPTLPTAQPPFEQQAAYIQQPQLPQQSLQTISSSSTSNFALESIANSLERIANKLESVDISVKKKRIKRVTK